jgi:hypothetical protein
LKDRRFRHGWHIYTSDWLSVQVHPDDAQAARFNREARKVRMWYNVSSGRKGYLAGVKPRDRGKTAASIEHGTRGRTIFVRPKA